MAAPLPRVYWSSGAMDEVRLEPSHARLRIDGGEPRREPDGALVLAVGTHQVDVEAEDYLSLHRDLVVPNDQGNVLSFQLSADGPTLPEVQAEEHKTEDAKLEPLARKHWFKDYPRTWSVAGGSALLGATSLALYLGARHADEQIERRCASGCDLSSPLDELTQQRDR